MCFFLTQNNLLIAQECEDEECNMKCEGAGAMSGMCSEEGACRCLDLFDDY